MNNQRPSVGKTIDYQAKQITYNVYSYYKARKMDPKTYEHQEDVNLIDTVSNVTGLSKSSVTRIIRDGNAMKLENGVAKFVPGIKKHIRKKRIEINEFTEGVIRRKVIQFYTVKKEVPSIRKLNSLLKQEKILYCSNEYLRQLLHNLGFTNADSESSGMIMEREDIVSQRFSYLQAIREFRAEKKRPILYLNEPKLWQTQSKAKTSKSSEFLNLIAVHGGTGFSDGSLVMLKMKSEINHEKDLRFEHFENYDWVKDTFIPKLAPGSVIVLNTPILNKIDAKAVDEKPTLTSTRASMQDWLKTNNVPFRDTDTKCSLFQLISNLDTHYEYSFDKVLKENGHEVIHLPINHPDLNPVLLALEELKGSSGALKDLFSKFKKEQWQACFDRVIQNENEYYEHDLKLDEAVHNLLSTVKKEKEDKEDENYEEDDDEDDMECEYPFV